VATHVELERSRIALAEAAIDGPESSRAAGEALAQALDPRGLVHVFVLAEGVRINGSALVEGMAAHLPAGVGLTGGLAADGDRFVRTLTFCDGAPRPGRVVALGWYGESLRVGCGSLGGWDTFGPERLVTRSRGCVVYELEGQSALGLYKRYLGPAADELPASGLHFPLSLKLPDEEERVVRTLLSVDEAEQSVTFAGEIPQGSRARLMVANFERLIDGASSAARASAQKISEPAELGILVSCVGRKLVLKQRVEEEVEGVREVLGPRAALAGFYSYGEISPFTPGARCRLHNQTMTITTFSEG
jgi:hypothetical protein